jgi:hypothetical protein
MARVQPPRGTEIRRQRHKNFELILTAFPKQCAIGVKRSSNGHEQFWRGGKLSVPLADGQILTSTVCTSANAQDGRAAIILTTLARKRVDDLYDRLDSADDANATQEHIRTQGHVPGVAFRPRQAEQRPSEAPTVRPPKRVPEMDGTKREHQPERTLVERMNTR